MVVLPPGAGEAAGELEAGEGGDDEDAAGAIAEAAAADFAAARRDAALADSAAIVFCLFTAQSWLCTSFMLSRVVGLS
jgi:hypothetical protein